MTRFYHNRYQQRYSKPAYVLVSYETLRLVGCVLFIVGLFLAYAYLLRQSPAAESHLLLVRTMNQSRLCSSDRKTGLVIS